MQHSAEQPGESLGRIKYGHGHYGTDSKRKAAQSGAERKKSLQVDRADGRFEYLGGKIPSVQQFVIAHKEFFK